MPSKPLIPRCDLHPNVEMVVAKATETDRGTGRVWREFVLHACPVEGCSRYFDRDYGYQSQDGPQTPRSAWCGLHDPPPFLVVQQSEAGYEFVCPALGCEIRRKFPLPDQDADDLAKEE